MKSRTMYNYLKNMKSVGLITMLFLFSLSTPSHAKPVTEGSGGIVLLAPESALDLVEYETVIITWYTNITEEIDRVEIEVEDTYNSEILDYTPPMKFLDNEELPETVNVSMGEGTVTFYGDMNYTTKFVGFNKIYIYLFDKDNKSIANFTQDDIKIQLKGQGLANIFSYSTAALTAILYFFMGSTLDLDIVKNIVKTPVGPILGLICQYGIMPSVAYGLGLLFFPDDVALRLGLFLNGCCPGGGQSNMWTHLIGGSLDLSIMMTTISTLAAFGTIPLWVLTVGPIIAADGNFEIPFLNILITVVTLIFPCVIGIALQIFYKRIVKIAKKILSPLSILILIYIFTFGIYSYRYTLYIMTWKSILAGFLLPFLGYVLGIVLARVCRLTWREAIAVGIETGVQNTTVTIIILAVAIETPTSTLAAVIPATNTLLTPVPLVIAVIVKLAYQKLCASDVGEITKPSDIKELSVQTKQSDIEKKQDGGIANPAAELSDIA